MVIHTQEERFLQRMLNHCQNFSYCYSVGWTILDHPHRLTSIRDEDIYIGLLVVIATIKLNHRLHLNIKHCMLLMK